MTYDVYRYIFIGAAILCGIMFVVSVLLFIFLKIPKIISDLTGATARKAIKAIREQNEASGEKAYKVSAFNEARGKLTDKISPSGNVIQQQQAQMRGIDTTKIQTQELEQSGETSVLDQQFVAEPVGETSVLDQQPVAQPAGETSVLDQFNVTVSLGETSVLSASEQPVGETSVLSAVTVDQTFSVEFEITYIHTNEVIA